MVFSSESTNFQNICEIKKQFLDLQKKMENAMATLEPSFEAVSSVKLEILNQAKIVSKDIMEAHDNFANCNCYSVTENSKTDGAIYMVSQQVMFDHLNTLKKLLGQLDAHKGEAKQPSITKKPLNPLSECFVPSSRVYRLIQEQKINSAQETQTSSSTEKEVSTKVTNTNYVLKDSLKEIWNRANPDCSGQAPAKSGFCSDRQRNTFSFQQRFSYGLNKVASIWSMRPEDTKLWYPRSVSTPCGCPPAFGYTVPPDFFGNPFKITNYCSEKDIHVCFNPNEDNRDVSEMRRPCPTPVSAALVGRGPPSNAMNDFNKHLARSSKQELNLRLDYYKKSFQKCVSQICDYTKRIENCAESQVSSQSSDDSISVTEEGRLLESSSQSDNQVGSSNEKLYSHCPIPYQRPQMPSKSDKISTELQGWKLKDTANAHENSVGQKKMCKSPCSIWCDSHILPKIANSTSIIYKDWYKAAENAKAECQHTRLYFIEKSRFDGNHPTNRNVRKPVTSPGSYSTISTRGKADPERMPQNSSACNSGENIRSRHSSVDSGYTSSKDRYPTQGRCRHQWFPKSRDPNERHYNAALYEKDCWIPLPHPKTFTKQRAEANSSRK